MARRVFFSFHYKNDVSRANVVRHSWVTKPSTEAAGFVDAAAFEQVERQGGSAVKRWIDDQLTGTSVTVVMIGAETTQREYVKYELEKSFSRGNGMLGIYIHNIKDLRGNTSLKGSNRFGSIGKNGSNNDVFFSIDYPTYDWVVNDGYNNLGKWVEEAAKKAGK